MAANRLERAEFDEQLFEKELRRLRKVVERGARRPPQDLWYTTLVLALLWLVVVVPVLTGILFAMVLRR